MDQRCAAWLNENGILRANDGEYPLYLGRFDWMNGYDNDAFGLGYRYLAASRALAGGGFCEGNLP